MRGGGSSKKKYKKIKNEKNKKFQIYQILLKLLQIRIPDRMFIFGKVEA